MSNHCPIPIGWTVRVYRIPEKHGVAIQADHEDGRGFTVDITVDPDPGPIDVTLPGGERATISEATTLNMSDEAQLAFLWSRAIARMRDQTP